MARFKEGLPEKEERMTRLKEGSGKNEEGMAGLSLKICGLEESLRKKEEGMIKKEERMYGLSLKEHQRKQNTGQKHRKIYISNSFFIALLRSLHT